MSSSSSTSSISSPQSQDVHMLPYERRLLDMDTWSEYNMFLNEVGGFDAQNELDKYIGEVREKNESRFNILNWWKLNALRFPILTLMARDILTVHISIVASESTFSIGGRVLNTFRSSLTPRMVQCLMCTKDWFRNEACPVSIEEDLEALEKMDQELENNAHQSAILDL